MRDGKIRYGARLMESGRWGIVVDIWHKDGNTTKDRNTMPYPSEALAVEYAAKSAHATADDEGIKDVAQYLTNPPIIAKAGAHIRFDHKYEPGPYGVCKRCGYEKH